MRIFLEKPKKKSRREADSGQLWRKAGLLLCFFAAAAQAAVPPPSSEANPPGAWQEPPPQNSPPDLSGEWALPCQNLGTDGLVFSRIARIAYIGNRAVAYYIDFGGPGCKCENFWEESDKIIWRFELAGEAEVFSGVYKIDYWPAPLQDGEPVSPFFSERYLELVKKEGRRLYFSYGQEEPGVRPEELNSEPYIFSRQVTESIEDYIAAPACP